MTNKSIDEDTLLVDENILDLYLKDILHRKSFISHFVRMLDNMGKKNNIVALEGGWGEGKTVFVKQAINLLIAGHQDNREHIEHIWSKYVDNRTMEQVPNDIIPIYFDAWKLDRVNNPTLAIAYKIVKSLDLKWKKSSWVDMETLIKSITGLATSCAALGGMAYGIPEIGALASSAETAISNLMSTKRSFKTFDYFESIENENSFDENLAELFRKATNNKQQRIVVFIDELDRCNPTFAVRLLEDIKHYFEQENVIFVFSINIHELQNTIKRYYGDSFDSYRYLDRFFDIRLQLPTIALLNYYKYINHNNTDEPLMTIDLISMDMIQHFKMSLREIERFSLMVNIAINQEKLLARGSAQANCHSYIVLLVGIALIALKLCDGKHFLTSIQMQEEKFFIDYFKRITDKLDNRDILKAPEEKWSKTSYIQNNDVYITFDDRVKQIHQLIFSDSGLIASPTTAFLSQVDNWYETKETVWNILTLMSNISNYNAISK